MTDHPAGAVLRKPGSSRSRDDGGLHLVPTPAPDRSLTPAFDGVESVEIVAPDRSCAMLLLDRAGSAFPAQLVPGPGWVVRFRPPSEGGEWVMDLLDLVERRLADAPISRTGIRRRGRSSLIHSPSDAA